MKPLFYMLLVPGPSGDYAFAGAFKSREKAEAKATQLIGPVRIEAANINDLNNIGLTATAPA